MDTQKVLMPAEKRVLVGGKEFVVRKLGLRQGVQLAAFMANFGPEVLKKAEAAQNAGMPELLAIAQAVGEEAVPELLQILLNAPSLEDKALFSDVSLEDISDVVEAITAVNDFKKIVDRFQKAVANVGGIKALSAIPGAAPSPSLH